MDVKLYTRTGCHLCDEAYQLLCQHGLVPVEVDIDRDESLREQFHTCVPVVAIDGKVRFRGRIEPVLLKRLIDNRRERSN
ncbi:MAG: glutaredoxin family protein [Planctomycetota bacterium]